MRTQKNDSRSRAFTSRLAAAALGVLCICALHAPNISANTEPDPQGYEYEETRKLVALVHDAAKLVETEGEAAFAEFRVPGSRWRQDETYIFVLDPEGTTLVHPDPEMEGRKQMDLKDINGRPIIRGLIHAATALPGKPQGWYHYEWPVPGGLLPRWKSSYARLATAPSGKRYIVSSGLYNDRMERAFVVDMVHDAVGQIEKLGDSAFTQFHDPTGPFMAKDAYVFVIDPNGVELVNPAFRNLEGRNLLDVKDTQGKYLVREMLDVVQTRGYGWVDYLWPRPGESVSTQKSAYVSKARVGDKWLLVGSGVYLADAPQAVPAATPMSAAELMAHVRAGAAVLEQRGEEAFPEFREKGSKWFHDDTYFFVWTTEGTRIFHAADPTLEGRDASGVTDALGRPYGRMFLEVAASPSGEGWVHYMFPEPGGIFPIWKSVFVKRIAFPSGKQHLIGAGIYNMKMEKAFIEDVVQRASVLIADHGEKAFERLRDKTGPFRFMDVYVFVDKPDGTNVVNPGQPGLEGKNIADLKDAKGKTPVREFIAAAMDKDSAWVEYYWYRPGYNAPSRKQTYVRKVESGQNTYIVGSGLYLEE